MSKELIKQLRTWGCGNALGDMAADEIERLTAQAIKLMDGEVDCSTNPQPREVLEQRIEAYQHVLDAERAKYAELEAENNAISAQNARFADDIERLHDICAAAYQMAGVVGAPVRFLDALSRPSETTQEQIDALLPVTEDEFGILERWLVENLCSGMVGADEGNDDALLFNALQVLRNGWGEGLGGRMWSYAPEQQAEVDRIRAMYEVEADAARSTSSNKTSQPIQQEEYPPVDKTLRTAK